MCFELWIRLVVWWLALTRWWPVLLTRHFMSSTIANSWHFLQPPVGRSHCSMMFTVIWFFLELTGQWLLAVYVCACFCLLQVRIPVQVWQYVWNSWWHWGVEAHGNGIRLREGGMQCREPCQGHQNGAQGVGALRHRLVFELCDWLIIGVTFRGSVVCTHRCTHTLSLTHSPTLLLTYMHTHSTCISAHAPTPSLSLSLTRTRSLTITRTSDTCANKRSSTRNT